MHLNGKKEAGQRASPTKAAHPQGKSNLEPSEEIRAIQYDALSLEIYPITIFSL